MLRYKDLDQLQILNINSLFRCILLGGTYIESVQPVLCLQNTRDTHSQVSGMHRNASNGLVKNSLTCDHCFQY